MVRPKRDAFGVLRGRHGLLAVLRDVDHDGTRLAMRGDVKRLRNDLGDFVRALDEEAVLGDAARDARGREP